jgi:hypothetical protein
VYARIVPIFAGSPLGIAGADVAVGSGGIAVGCAGAVVGCAGGAVGCAAGALLQARAINTNAIITPVNENRRIFCFTSTFPPLVFRYIKVSAKLKFNISDSECPGNIHIYYVANPDMVLWAGTEFYPLRNIMLFYKKCNIIMVGNLSEHFWRKAAYPEQEG